MDRYSVIAKIAVENLAYDADREYDYGVPERLVGSVLPGVRVKVPFGRGRMRVGLVLSLSDSSDFERLRAVSGVIDEYPLFSGEMLRVLGFVRERYFCTYFEAARAMLPGALRVDLDERYSLVSKAGDSEGESPSEKGMGREHGMTGGRGEESSDAVDGTVGRSDFGEKEHNPAGGSRLEEDTDLGSDRGEKAGMTDPAQEEAGMDEAKSIAVGGLADKPDTPRDERELAVIAALSELGATSESELSVRLGYDAFPVINRLMEKGIVAREAASRRRLGDAYRKTAALAVDFEEAGEYLDSAGKLGEKHGRVIDALMGGDLPVSELIDLTGVGVGVIKTLEKRGILRSYMSEALRSPLPADVESNPEEIRLTAPQERAYSALSSLVGGGGPSAALLYGITGSGKTLVYMRVIDDVLEKGRSAMVLVPEISLTAQLVERFAKRYGDLVALLHSGLSDGERYDEWKRIKSGAARVVIGARSAVFAPTENLGVIIVDEEQDSAYKSENGPRYSAVSVAKFLGVVHNALVILSSATPSVEAYSQAVGGRIALVELPDRYGEYGLPDVIVSDMRDELMEGNDSVIGSVLKRELEKTLDFGDQAILFLNRRGYNTHVSCRKCGYVATCPDCSVAMTYHRLSGRIMCHYCGRQAAAPSVCPECGSDKLMYTGAGTQKIEEELAEMLPGARVIRMDADTTGTKSSHSRILSSFLAGDYDILVGTQMVTKGLDMPGVTLVGVLGADPMLYMGDYRASERAFSMLTQVIGRAGRAKKKGRAVIQTYTPDSKVIELAKRQDYPAFYAEEILFRKMMAFPPYSDIYRFAFSGPGEKEAAAAAEQICRVLGERFSKEKIRDVVVFPPSVPPVSKVAGKFRYRIYVKCRDSREIRRIFGEILREFYAGRKYKGVSAGVDVNPADV